LVRAVQKVQEILEMQNAARYEQGFTVSLYISHTAREPDTTITQPLLSVRTESHKIFLALKLVSRIKVGGMSNKTDKADVNR
jgi:hypothetical protein